MTNVNRPPIFVLSFNPNHIKIMNLINLTPHAVNVLDADGNEIAAIPPSGTVARVEKMTRTVGFLTVDGKSVPLLESKMGKPTDLPFPEDGVVLIVSLLVKQACPLRTDLVTVEDVVRDGSTIKGCRAFGI